MNVLYYHKYNTNTYPKLHSNLLYLLQLNIHPPGLDPEKLFKLIPKKCLPKEYGGDLPSENELHQITVEKFYAKQKFWNLEEKIRKQSQ